MAYTNEWKAQVQEFAGSRSAGDIRVEVTGGTITADGDGIQARYLVRHEGNGAVSVDVDEGASVPLPHVLRGRLPLQMIGCGSCPPQWTEYAAASSRTRTLACRRRRTM